MHPDPPLPTPELWTATVYGTPSRNLVRIDNVKSYSLSEGMAYLTTTDGEVHAYRISHDGIVLRPKKS